ncbi:MAG: hypothetical protein U1F36_20985 [Planctomycetota bacterium]
MQRNVSIRQSGRDGQVTYTEAEGAITGHWEFGGGDVTAIVSMGSEAEWRTRHRWAVARRAEILRFVAEEVCRQKAPGHRAEIDESSGAICLRPGGDGLGRLSATPLPQGGEPAHAWVSRYASLRARFAMILTIGALLVVGLIWLKNRMFSIVPGPGTPVGLCVRTDMHVATWLQSLEPYVPSLHRDGSKDRFTLSVLLVPLDGAEPSLVPVHHELPPNSFSLAKILGSDGRSLWVDGHGLCRIDLDDLSVHEESGVAPANLIGAVPSPLPPRPEHFLARGWFDDAGAWIGLLSASESARDYAPGKFVRRGSSMPETKETRRLLRAAVEPDDSGKFQRLVSTQALGESEYLDGGLLRLSPDSEPQFLHDPDSLLVVATSAAGPQGTLTLTRVDLSGKVLWQTDTGIARFTAQQLLPGPTSTVIVGTQPRQPDRLPEPIVAIVDGASGGMVVRSLSR